MQGIHDETNGLCDLLGPDCVLLKFGLHRRLGNALLEQTEVPREVGANTSKSQAVAFTARDRARESHHIPESKTYLKSPLKILKLKHPYLKSFCKGAP